MKANRVFYLDILRVVSIFSVVVLHVAAPFVVSLYNNGMRWWWVGNLIDSATRCCVPVLIIISGKLILDNNKNEDILFFLKKRLKKVFIPLFFWSFFYMIWNSRSNLQLDISFVKGALKMIYEGNVNIHLWYLYMIAGIYLITPIIKPFINNADKSNILYFIIVWFIVNGVLDFFGRLIGIRIGVYLNFFHWTIGYYILGYYLAKQEFSKKALYTIYTLGIIGFLTTVLGTYILTSNNEGVFLDSFYSYAAPNVIFMAISIFLFFKNRCWENIILKRKMFEKIMVSFSKTSFGIYLIHPFFIDVLRSETIGIQLTPFSFNYIIGIPLISLIIFLISHFTVLIISKVPIVRNIVS